MADPLKGPVKHEARVASRGDLSTTTDPQVRKELLEDKALTFNNKGFFGTPLPLIADIRTSEVREGITGKLLDALGISKRQGRIVTLRKGPNKRLNRYLVFQYTRLIKSIKGTLIKGDIEQSSHVL